MALIECPECGKRISENSNSCRFCNFPIPDGIFLHNDSRNTRIHSNPSKGKLIGYIFIALISVFLIFMISNNFQPQKFEKEATLLSNEVIKRKAGILKHEIVEKQDISYSDNRRMVYRIVLNVNSLPTVEEMINTATTIWEDGNKSWNEFTVFIYLPEMDTGLTAFGVGEFNNKGLVTFNKNDYSLEGTKWVIEENKEAIKETSAVKLKEYIVDLDVVKMNEKEIKIIVITDFPDGTNFLVSVDRGYYQKGLNDIYSGEIYNKDFAVEQGKIELTVTINDSEWYNEHLRKVRILPDVVREIEDISDNLTVSVLYSAAREQPIMVKKILGSRGEFITGKGADTFGSGTAGKLTVFNVSKEINFPFQK